MKRLPLAIFVIVLVLTFGCDTNQGSFGDTLPNLHTLTTNVFPAVGGTVHPSGGEFSSGDGIEIEARPADGYVFDRWEDDLTGNSNPDSLFFNANRTVTAHFVPRDYDLNIEVIGEGYVRETVVEQSSGGGAADSPYVTVRLTAVAEDGWHFDRWEGDLGGSENPETITVDEEKNVTAVFGQEDTDEDEPDGAVTLEIKEVRLFIDELKLDGNRRTKDFKTKNFIANLPLDGTPFTITHQEIPVGLYDEFELKIDKPDDKKIDVDDSDFRDETGSYSVVVKGSYHGVEFTFRSIENFDIDVDLEPPLEISEGQNSLIVISVDVESWFTGADGEILDPKDFQNTKRINDNIKKSFEDFEDEFEND